MARRGGGEHNYCVSCCRLLRQQQGPRMDYTKFNLCAAARSNTTVDLLLGSSAVCCFITAAATHGTRWHHFVGSVLSHVLLLQYQSNKQAIKRQNVTSNDV